MNKKLTTATLLIALLCLASCRPAQQAQRVSGTGTTNPRNKGRIPQRNLNILPWPDGKTPEGFMSRLQLISLPTKQCQVIVEEAKPGEAPKEKPDLKNPLAAAYYFGTHLNMGDPPKYMAVYTNSEGVNFYLFSGGLHWKMQPLFSEAVVLLETGEIRFYRKVANN